MCVHIHWFLSLPCPSPLATPLLLLLLLLRFFSLRAQCRHICIFIRECNRRARFSPLVARYRGKNSRKMAERFEADMRSDFLSAPPPLFLYRYLRENNNVSSSTTADLGRNNRFSFSLSSPIYLFFLLSFFFPPNESKSDTVESDRKRSSTGRERWWFFPSSALHERNRSIVGIVGRRGLSQVCFAVCKQAERRTEGRASRSRDERTREGGRDRREEGKREREG